MPDLQPNVSFYNNQQQMTPDKLLGLVTGLRQLQEQQAAAKALQAPGAFDANGVPNQAAITQNYIQNAGPAAQPGRVQEITGMAQVQGAFNQWQNESVAKILGPLADIPGGPTDADVNRAALQLSKVVGVDKAHELTQAMIGASNGAERINRLTQVQNSWGGGVPQAGSVTGAQGPQFATPGQQGYAARTGANITPQSAGYEAPYLHGAQNSADYQRQVAPLEKAIPALARLGKGGTYPEADRVNDIKTTLSAWGWAKPDLDKIKDFNSAKKGLSDWVNQQGGDTDLTRMMVTSANPNVRMEDQSAQDLAKYALTLRRMQQAGHVAFEQSGQPKSMYNQFMSRFMSNQDPLAYGMDMYTKAQRDKIQKSLTTPDAQARFRNSYNAYKNAGIERRNIDWNAERSQ